MLMFHSSTPKSPRKKSLSVFGVAHIYASKFRFAPRCREVCVTPLHINFQATGGTLQKRPGWGTDSERTPCARACYCGYTYLHNLECDAKSLPTDCTRYCADHGCDSRLVVVAVRSCPHLDSGPYSMVEGTSPLHLPLGTSLSVYLSSLAIPSLVATRQCLLSVRARCST
ncbi:hypothetical protein OG21DRAFT_1514795 [Imleria badia]|nr:hypothetical protein OG21DRAFT_1514795 [Imleria badia]